MSSQVDEIGRTDAEPPRKKRVSESPTGSPVAVPIDEGRASLQASSSGINGVNSPKTLNKEATVIVNDTLHVSREASVTVITNERATFRSPRPITMSKSLPEPRDVFGTAPLYLEDSSLPPTLTTAASTSCIDELTSPLPKAKGKGKAKPPKPPKPPTQKEIKAAKAAKLAAEKKMSPVQYAATLPDKWGEHVSKLPRNKLYLSGKCILYVWNEPSGSMQGTRNKMDILYKAGATLMTEYDPERVTHIVASLDTQKNVLQMCGIRKVTELPVHIKTVTWEWIVHQIQGINHTEIYYEPFISRMKQVSQAAKGEAAKDDASSSAKPSYLETSARKREETDDEGSPKKKAKHGSGFQPLQPPSLDASSSSNLDPLAEFYEQAKLMDEFEVEEDEEKPQAVTPSEASEGSKTVSGRWQCDGAPVSSGVCPNQDIVDKLLELREIHSARQGSDDLWRTFSYRKSIANIKAFPKRIESYSGARSIKGVGDKTALKIMEIVQTGELERLKHARTDDIVVAQLFQGIYGVGPATAFSWYSQGLRTLEDVKNGKNGVSLSLVQEIGLKFYDDINDRMPRSEAAEIFCKIRQIALTIDAKLYMEIMGSFRRGKATCGDIDILLTRPTDDGKTHHDVMRVLLRRLHEEKILTYDLATPDDLDDLEATYRGLCQVDTAPGRRQRRIDILSVPYGSLGGALLYYTGDDIFNRSMRLKASLVPRPYIRCLRLLTFCRRARL